MSDKCDVIKSLHISEKSTSLYEHGIVTFKVDRRASKRDIVFSIKSLFNLSSGVLDVNVVNYYPQKVFFRNRVGYRARYKKCFVRFSPKVIAKVRKILEVGSSHVHKVF